MFLCSNIYILERNWIHLPELDKLMRRNFEDSNMPYIAEIENTRTSLLLINNHESFSYAKPGMPNMVNVAGMHIEPSEALPSVTNLHNLLFFFFFFFF